MLESRCVVDVVEVSKARESVHEGRHDYKEGMRDREGEGSEGAEHKLRRGGQTL